MARLLARRPDGIFVSDFEQGEIGPELFRMATAPIAPAELGEGEEPKHPAMTRVMEAFREKRS